MAGSGSADPNPHPDPYQNSCILNTPSKIKSHNYRSGSATMAYTLLDPDPALVLAVFGILFL
jgi:hypothetical protein